MRVGGIWHDEAPLLRTEVRFAAGSGEHLFAHVFVAGGIRPLFTSDVVSGGDVALGVGFVGRWVGFVARIDGGLALGFDGTSAGIDTEAPDQRGGFFGLQRLELAYELFDLLELSALGAAAIPLEQTRIENPAEEGFAATWDVTWGSYLTVRF